MLIVETNPGPNVHKDCPICNSMVPIRSKSCTSCGFKFNKKIKGIGKIFSLGNVKLGPPMDNTVSSPVTTSTASSSNPAEMTLPSQLSPAPQDDTVNCISCSVPVMASEVAAKQNNDTVKESLSQPTKTSQKWAKYKEIINSKRRTLYKENPLPKRLQSQKITI